MGDPVRDPNISVIIPVHDGGDDFIASLEAIGRTDPAPAEVIVVADGSTDGSGEAAVAAGYRLLERDVPGGPAVARNLGAGQARGEILLFVDSDVTVQPDIIARVAETFREDPGLAAVIGSYDDSPAGSTFISGYRNLLHHYVHQTGQEEAFTFWGACGAIRRKVFDTLGGYDENYPEPSIEDIELGYRLRKAGYRIRLRKDLQVKHLKSWTFVSMLKTDFFKRAMPWTRLILGEGKMPDDLNIRVSGRVSVILACLLPVLLAASLWRLWFLVPALASGLSLFWINRGFYAFLFKKRGLLFTLGALPLHWFYFLYSGLAFGIGLLAHRFDGAEGRSLRRAAGNETPGGEGSGAA